MGNDLLREHCLGRIVDNQVNGASELARDALELVAEFARDADAESVTGLRSELDALASALRRCRSGMAPIDNLLGLWQLALDDWTRADLDGFRDHSVAAATALAASSRRAVQRVVEHTTSMIDDGTVIITHSLSSTVSAVFRALRGREVAAIVTESAPGREGRTLAAQLSALAISTEFISDAQLGLFAGRAGIALVGADSVLADGSVVNKAGTYLLALAARDQGVPFYVCAESFKCSDATAEDLVVKEAPIEQLQAPDLPGVAPRNIAFDVTPARLISAWVDEDGVALAYPVRGAGAWDAD